MKIILVIIHLVIFLLLNTAHSQEIYFENNLYNSEIISKKNNKAFLREKWFYEQRLYSSGSIPTNAYGIALIQKINLSNSSGFYFNNGNWTALGPTPGQNTNYGNVSSRIVTVKFDPANPQIIYAGTACGGVWKTTNSGSVWFPLTDFQISLASGALAVQENNSNIVYIGTGEATYFTYSYYGSGLLKSTNGGISWLNYTSGLPANTYFSRLVIKPGNPDILFAALGTSGLYKSVNSGQTWSLIEAGRCDDVIFSSDGSKAYIIGNGTGFKLSVDGGNSFTLISPFNLGTRSHLAISKSNPSVLYAVTYRDTSVYVYKSTNSGYNFSLLNNTFTGTTQAWYDFYIHINPFDENNAFIGLVDLWRTTNGRDFVKITNTSAGPVHVDHHNMDFHPADPNAIIIANDGGVNYSTNRGTNWINLNATLNLTQFYRIASDPVNASHIIGGTQDNGVQRTIGTLKWDVVYGGDGGDVCFNPKNSSYILSENQFNAIRRSTDGGVSWANAVTGISGTGAWIAPIIANPNVSGTFYTARQQLFKTTNNASSWSLHSTGLTGTIRELAISKSNPSIIFASSNNSIFKSTDDGKTFSAVSHNLPNKIITSINIHPDSSDVLISTLSGFGTGHFYKSADGGKNWTNISGNLPDSPVNDGLIYYPGYSTSIYIAAADAGVFITNDFGRTWSELAEGLPNTVCMHLDYNSTAAKLRVATHGRGVWEFNGQFSGIINFNNYIPESFKVYDNYPNPFNASTIIKIGNEKTQLINVTIFNSLGQKITTLNNKVLSPGTYDILFESGSLSTGIYYFIVTGETFSQTKKMLMLK